MNKKIGIITINLNNEQGLEKTLKSVTKQTYKNYELIIIDGGSTDNSINVIKKYEKYITYWLSEKDNGIYNAMNKGIKKCNSEYIIFLNSGDSFYEKNILEKIVPNLLNDIVYGDLLINNNGKNFIKKYNSKIDKQYFLKDTLPHQASFIKKSLFDGHLYDENYKIISDWIFFYESIIYNKCTYKYLPYIISNYSLDGISSNYTELLKEKYKYLISLKENINILINTHKSFNIPVTSKCYEIVSTKEIIKDLNFKTYTCKNVDLPLKDDFYSEFYQFKYVNDNIELPKYVGFCHYRRYFSFLDNILDMDEIFSKYDCIVSKPLELQMTVREQYAINHNIEDLEIVGKIIEEKYPEYSHWYNVFLENNIMIPYNMFIMKKEDFKKYIDFIFGILNEYIKIVGTDIHKRIEENKEKYLKNFYPNNTIEYQYRIGGYLGERLTNIFLLGNFKKMKFYDVMITEDKYIKR